jgi:MFS superfamily sulfate permease-like transporter
MPTYRHGERGDGLEDTPGSAPMGAAVFSAALGGFPAALRALAVSTLAAGLAQGCSVGASQSRTTVNNAAGGRAQLARLVSVASLVLFLLFLTPLLRPLPMGALGSILIFAGVNLVDVKAYRMLRRISHPAFYLALLVTAGVWVSGVVPGMLIGAMLSLATCSAGARDPPTWCSRRSRTQVRFTILVRLTRPRRCQA